MSLSFLGGPKFADATGVDPLFGDGLHYPIEGKLTYTIYDLHINVIKWHWCATCLYLCGNCNSCFPIAEFYRVSTFADAFFVL